MKSPTRAKVWIALLAPLVGLLFVSTVTTVRSDDRGFPAPQGRPFDLRVALKTPDVSRVARNSTIDCSTNRAYRSGEYADYVHSVGHTKIASDCRSCHQAVRPTVGVGDRPTTRFASFALANYTDEAQNYYLTAGSKGEWTEMTIEPKKVRTFSWRYDDPRDPRSPIYWIHFRGSTYRLVPLATPNENIGSLYYFASDARGKAAPYSPARQPLRSR